MPNPINRRRCIRVLSLLVAAVFLLSPSAAYSAGVKAPEQPQPTMPVDQVRVGMRGYGLTVFHGTTIEPFAVEVLSVVPTSTAGHATIWVRCDDDRLAVSGPVQGMSGSPIYLWDEGVEGELGKDGRLIGAFAFGHQMVKECLAGVQPIAYMRGTGQRARDQEAEPMSRAGIADPTLGLAILAGMQRDAGVRGIPESVRYPLDLTHALLSSAIASADQPVIAGPTPATVFNTDGRQARPLLIPMMVGSDDLADTLAPLFAPAGVAPMAGVIGQGGPPPGIDADTPLEPGSVLAIPLATGDLDLNASGTVTDVLPDGTVLGFGHAMFGQGPSAVPMASGYIHFLVPRVTTSFKQAGSLKVYGSIVQDEQFAVAGVDRKAYTTAPVEISVTLPGQQPQHYHYEMVNHPQLGPGIAATIVSQSLVAVHNPPIKSTARVTGKVVLTGGREIAIDRRLMGPQAGAAVVELSPVLVAAMLNPFEELALESMSLDFVIDDGLHIATIESAVLNDPVVAPGETAGLVVTCRPYGQDAVVRRVAIDIPTDLPDGEYTVSVSDAASYAGRALAGKPYLGRIRSVDDMLETMTLMSAIDRDALYVTIPRQQPAFAIGRQPMPDLPGSRAALLAKPGRTDVMQFNPVIESRVETPWITQGDLTLPMTVRSPNAPTP